MTKRLRSAVMTAALAATPVAAQPPTVLVMPPRPQEPPPPVLPADRPLLDLPPGGVVPLGQFARPMVAPGQRLIPVGTATPVPGQPGSVRVNLPTPLAVLGNSAAPAWHWYGYGAVNPQTAGTQTAAPAMPPLWYVPPPPAVSSPSELPMPREAKPEPKPVERPPANEGTALPLPVPVLQAHPPVATAAAPQPSVQEEATWTARPAAPRPATQPVSAPSVLPPLPVPVPPANAPAPPLPVPVTSLKPPAPIIRASSHSLDSTEWTPSRSARPDVAPLPDDLMAAITEAASVRVTELQVLTRPGRRLTVRASVKTPSDAMPLTKAVTQLTQPRGYQVSFEISVAR